MIGQRELAGLAGVTQATVSMALRNDLRVSESTRKRIQRLAREAGYKVDPALGMIMAKTRQYGTGRSTLAFFLGVTPTEFAETGAYQELSLGVETRCKELGFHLDRFWMHDGRISPKRQAAILSARGISGVVILWHKRDPIGERFSPIYKNFACSIVGTRPSSPHLHVAMPDHFKIGNAAFERAIALGYKRPSALIYPEHDATTDFRLSLGCIAAQRMLPLSEPVPPLVKPYESAEVLVWLDRYRPDFLLVTEEQTFNYFARIPRFKTLRLYHWDVPQVKNRHEGFEQNGRMIGAAGVDLVIGQLHRNERGEPFVQKCVMIEGT